MQGYPAPYHKLQWSDYLNWKSHILENNHIKYESNTPPQVKVENAKISVYVESPHHFNIFF